MGGKVSVKSEIDKGTSFKIELLTICQLEISKINKIKNTIRRKSTQRYCGLYAQESWESQLTFQANKKMKKVQKLKKKLHRSNKEVITKSKFESKTKLEIEKKRISRIQSC